MIPKHKCSALCRKEEGIHVLPSCWYEGRMSINEWQVTHASRNIVILNVRREEDVTPGLCEKFSQHAPDWFLRKPIFLSGDVGYLLTVRDKETPTTIIKEEV